MKATELMVGDYVSVKPSGMLIKVSAVHKKKVAYHSCVSRFDWVRESLLEPIPITKEILEKNGWKKLDTAYWWKGEISVLLDMYDEQYGWCLSIDRYHIPCECKFVHQLQQAMRLCGIKKEIEL